MYRGRTFLVLHAPLIELEAEVAGECGVAETERVGESHRRNLLQARPFSDQDGKGFLLADPVDGYDRRAIKRRTVVSRGGMCLVMIYMVDASCWQIQVVYRPNLEAVWFFSKKDYLPRRVERINTNPSGERGAAPQLTVAELKLDPKFKDDPYKLVVPEGYEKTDEFAPSVRPPR